MPKNFDHTGADHGADIAFLRQHYNQTLGEFGDNPGAVQQSSWETQERRFGALSDVADSEAVRNADILDFGCGLGHMLTWLRDKSGFEGNYTGVDISEDMIHAARDRFPDDNRVVFEHRSILTSGLERDYDFVFVSGTFNNRVANNWRFMTDHLEILYNHTNVALAFNCLSAYVDFFADGLSYFDPSEVFNFCKENLSPLVTLKHDYHIKDDVVPYEFSTYVYRTDQRCVTLKKPS